MRDEAENYMDPWEEVDHLTRERDEARALLREVEWALVRYCTTHQKWEQCCPVCHGCQMTGHNPDCRLHAALAGLDATQQALREEMSERDTLRVLLREVAIVVAKCHDCINLHTDETLAQRIDAALEKTK